MVHCRCRLAAVHLSFEAGLSEFRPPEAGREPDGPRFPLDRKLCGMRSCKPRAAEEGQRLFQNITPGFLPLFPGQTRQFVTHGPSWKNC